MPHAPRRRLGPSLSRGSTLETMTPVARSCSPLCTRPCAPLPRSVLSRCHLQSWRWLLESFCFCSAEVSFLLRVPPPGALQTRRLGVGARWPPTHSPALPRCQPGTGATTRRPGD